MSDGHTVAEEPEAAGPLEEPEAPAPGPEADEPREPPKPGWYALLPRRVRVVLWFVLVGWLGLGLWAFGGWDVIRERVARAPRTSRPSADLALLVARGDGGSQPAMAILHRARGGSGLVLLPVGTLVEVPGVGPSSLASALGDTGADGLATAAANALGIRIPGTLVGDPAQVRGLVDLLGGVDVDVPESIEVEEGGFRRTLFGRGRRSMRGDDFLRFMTIAVPGQNELERVARQNAGWRGLLARMRARPRLARDVASRLEPWSGDLAGAPASRLLYALARDREVSLTTLPVVRAGLSQVDLYNIERSQLAGVRRVLTDVTTYRSPQGRRIRLLVGAEGASGPAAARPLVEAGYVIVLSGRAGQLYDTTRVVMAEDTDEARQTARLIIDIMGMGRIGLSKAPQTLVDVTVVVGKDWANAHA